MSDQHPLIARYMKEFERALELHEVNDKRDIAVELEGHIDEALAGGKALDATLESLGPADTLARAYAIELHMNRRKGTSPAARFVKVASILAASSCMTFLVTTTLGFMSASLVSAGVLILILMPMELLFDLPGIQVGVHPLLAIAISLAAASLGAVLGWVFWLYLRFLSRTLRKSLPRAWAAQPA